ncbi:MAG TPA: glucose-1-phosphate thymidylyltransferase [Capillibacterium sp.]
MKALLLCGGEGTRLRPFTHTTPKALLPLGHQPVLFHILDALAGAALREVVIIIGPNGAPIIPLLEQTNRWGLRFTFIPQPEPLGLAHTVILAREALGDEPFLMYLGDNLLEEPLRPLIDRFTREKPDVLLLLRPVKDPRHFGVASVDGSRITRVEEKPAKPASNLALTGIYLFSPVIHRAVRAIQPSRRGELEITDAIQWLIANGKTVVYHLVSGWWKDTGTVADLLAANRHVLKKMAAGVHGEIKKTQVQGVLAVKKGSLLKNCLVKGPVSIGAGCRITGSVLGPYLSVGDGAEIINSCLSRSLLFPGVRLAGVTLTDSILGERVRISSTERKEKPFSLLIGADGVLNL